MDFQTAHSVSERANPGATNAASLFQTDTIAAAQFFDDRRSKTLPEPEKRLMLAIFADAVSCFQDNRSAKAGKQKRLFDDAERWFFSASGDWVFGFENICSVFELNPEYIRLGLKRWREKQSKSLKRTDPQTAKKDRTSKSFCANSRMGSCAR